MKRIWIAFLFIAIVISTCVWGQITVNNAYKDLSEGFIKINELNEKRNYEKAKVYGEDVLENWNKYNSRLSALKNHDDLHDLIIDINLINKLIEDENSEKIEEVCDDALIRLEHIRDGEKISFGNVF